MNSLILFCVCFVRLMRIYGALMWSMGKVLQTPEVSLNNFLKMELRKRFWDFDFLWDIKKNEWERYLMKFICLFWLVGDEGLYRIFLGWATWFLIDEIEWRESWLLNVHFFFISHFSFYSSTNQSNNLSFHHINQLI